MCEGGGAVRGQVESMNTDQSPDTASLISVYMIADNYWHEDC